MSSPVASSRSRHRRRGQPAVERADGVVGPYSACNEQPPGVEEPRVAQRLEGVEEGDPAAQRHQHRAVHAALGPGHRPAQHEAVVAGPGRRAGRGCSGRRPAARRRRPAAAPTASAGGRTRRAARRRSACAAPRGRATSRRRRRRPGAATAPGASSRSASSERVPARPAPTGPGSTAARAAIACTAVCTRHRLSTSAGTSFGFTFALGAQVRREPVADGDQPAPAPEPGRRRGGLRGHVDLGQRQVAAPPGCTTSRPGWRNAVNAAISPSTADVAAVQSSVNVSSMTSRPIAGPLSTWASASSSSGVRARRSTPDSSGIAGSRAHGARPPRRPRPGWRAGRCRGSRRTPTGGAATGGSGRRCRAAAPARRRTARQHVGRGVGHERQRHRQRLDVGAGGQLRRARRVQRQARRRSSSCSRSA